VTIDTLNGIAANDGDGVVPDLMSTALTAAELVFDDGNTQVFRADGTTTYVESGRDTPGEWSVAANGDFCSFWPSSYRACYDLSWMVEAGTIVGLRFVERGKGSRFDGRYR
jgi:hypothetical protein